MLRQPSPEQRAAFIRWLKASPANVRDFLLMLAVEEALEDLDSQGRREIESLLTQAGGPVVSLLEARAEEQPRSRRRRVGWLAAAASVVLCAAVWAVLGHISASGWTEFVTATGEQRAFELVDGSIIHLNTHSRLALRFSAHLREVRLLQGEALFRVHHDSARPFLVYTADAMVQATGTQFDVYRRPDGTQVAVIEGRVNVTPEAHPALAEYDLPAARPRVAEPSIQTPKRARSLGVSQEAHVGSDGELSVKTVPDVAAVLAWRERRLVFNRETLQHIVDEFNRYSARQLRLEDVDLGARVFSGVFDADDPDSLAQVLARASDVSVRYDGNVIVLAQTGAPAVDR